MSDVKWIKIIVDIFDDEKIILIESMPEADSILVIWFKILCLSGKTNNGGVLMLNNKIPYTEEMLATIFRRPINTVRLALKTFEEFGMIEIINDVVTIPNWSKHQNLDQLEERKEYMKNYMQQYREKQKMLATGDCKVNSKANSKANSKVNVNSLEVDIEKEKDINIEDFFKNIWSFYPNKKGVNKVSKKQKAILYKLGTEKVTKCIESYKSYVEAQRKTGFDLKYQNGSTFFNSGYADYLESDIKATPQPVKLNFVETDYLNQ